MNMFLEDPLSEKNSKTLNNYIKLMVDVQIENNVEKRLRNRQECNDIMERIKKYRILAKFSILNKRSISLGKREIKKWKILFIRKKYKCISDGFNLSKN